MTRLWIRPSRISWASVQPLAEKLNAKRINCRISRFRARSWDRVLNWGNSLPTAYQVHLNQAFAIQRAVNKRITWRILHDWGIPTVAWTEDRGVAQEWLESGSNIYLRRTLTGFGGAGIEVVRPGNNLLLDEHEVGTGDFGGGTYTKGFPTHREFRVVVVGDTAVVVREKKKRRGTHPDPLIRNHGDWVFCINDLDPYPDTVVQHSVQSIKALGLDLGGVDICLDRYNNTCVLEVNTAPSLNGTAVDKVAEAIKEFITSRYP